VCALPAEDLLPAVGGNIELLPRHVHGEAGGGSVAEGKALAVVRDEIASLLDANSGGGAVEGETDVVLGVDLGEVREGSVVGCVLVDIDSVAEVEVGDGVTEPALR